MDEKNGKCELCGNECELTVHHLIPVSQSRHKNKYLKTDEGNLLSFLIFPFCFLQVIHFPATWTNPTTNLPRAKAILTENPGFPAGGGRRTIVAGRAFLGDDFIS